MISIIVPTEYTYHFPTTYTSVKQILLPVTRPLHVLLAQLLKFKRVVTLVAIKDK
jgi:hypothetical protein